VRRFLLRRLASSAALFVGVVALVFSLVRLTGDPARLMAPREATPAQVEALRRQLGFDRPLLVQFADYLSGALRGDLGESLRFGAPTASLVLERVPLTAALAALALSIALALALPLGIAAGMHAGRPIDALARGVGLLGQVTPSYWLALLLIIVFAVELGLFPSFGIDGPRSFVLPAAALAAATAGRLVRLTRAAVLEVVGADFVRTARSKGLPPVRVAVRHVLRNAAIPLVSVVSVEFTYLLGGAVYVETIFSLPGMGSLLDEAIRARDFPLVQAITIFIAGSAILISVLADLVYAWLDPRVRLEG
jgi:ABC-type dipeptide/oligopeptide/nickel transport system permease component